MRTKAAVLGFSPDKNLTAKVVSLAGYGLTSVHLFEQLNVRVLSGMDAASVCYNE